MSLHISLFEVLGVVIDKVCFFSNLICWLCKCDTVTGLMLVSVNLWTGANCDKKIIDDDSSTFT